MFLGFEAMDFGDDNKKDNKKPANWGNLSTKLLTTTIDFTEENIRRFQEMRGIPSTPREN